MNKVPYLIFCLIFFVDYTIYKTPLPGVFGWTPELLSAVLIVVLLLRMASTKVFNLPVRYLVLFGLLILHMIVGIILNDVTEGPIIVGLRYYLKFFPFFLLPAVFSFSDIQMKTQLKVLLALALLQLPVTVYQRFIEFSNVASGDSISGTLRISSILSIFLICSIFVTLAYYLKKRISGKLAFLIAILLFIPCTLNETKGSIVLLPFGLLSMIIISFRSDLEVKKALGIFSVLGILFLGFAFAYNSLYQKIDSGGGLLSFFSGDAVESYLYQDVQFDPEILDRHGDNSALASKTIEEEVRMPRMDRLIAPFAIMYTKPLNLYFGLGIGNVTQPKFPEWAGEYTYISHLMAADRLMMSLMLWEIGIGGVIIYLIFFYMLFVDIYRLSNMNSFASTVATGWMGVLTLIVIALVYKNIAQFNVIGYLFFYFSGYIAAARFKSDAVDPNSLLVEQPTKSTYFVTPLPAKAEHHYAK